MRNANTRLAFSALVVLLVSGILITKSGVFSHPDSPKNVADENGDSRPGIPVDLPTQGVDTVHRIQVAPYPPAKTVEDMAKQSRFVLAIDGLPERNATVFIAATEQTGAALSSQTS